MSRHDMSTPEGRRDFGIEMCEAAAREADRENQTMWDVHTCANPLQPTFRCRACWAAAYDPDGDACTANLRAIGYPPPA